MNPLLLVGVGALVWLTSKKKKVPPSALLPGTYQVPIGERQYLALPGSTKFLRISKDGDSKTLSGWGSVFRPDAPGTYQIEALGVAKNVLAVWVFEIG